MSGEQPPRPSAVKSLAERIKRASQWMIRPGGGLTQRIVHAGIWAFVLSLTVRLLNSVRRIVLGNLLTPEDFGIIGVVIIVTGLLNKLTVSGFERALVQRKEENVDEYLNTAWTVQIFRGTVTALGLVLLAPTVGRFFDSPNSVDVMRVVSIGVFIFGFRNIGIIYFRKNLEFQRQFALKIVGPLGQLVTSVILAIVLRNYWAMAWGMVAANVLAVPMSYLFHPYRPRLRFDWGQARELGSFGKWIFGSNILVYVMLNIDDLAVGRLLDTSALGLYQMAFAISQLATTEITLVIGKVAFPAYSRLQDDKPRLRSAYTKAVTLIGFVAFPLTVFLWFMAETVIDVFLPERWLPMLVAFQVLLLWGFLRSLLATTGPLFQAVGRPQLNTAIQAVQAATLLVIVFPMTAAWGIEGAAWATVVAAVMPDLGALVLAHRLVDARLGSFGKDLAFAAVHTALMLGALFAVAAVRPTSSFAWLVTALVVGGATYGLGVLVSRQLFGYLDGGLLPKVGRLDPASRDLPLDDELDDSDL